eukprot:TRINITY_DN107345_c0_g1_i1.p1 TRINITY_DN107345_c0_g1~~TRINITY_DN107345_c0_g1_i1.p1  ORF type:complete len:118 (-),score=6.17 TRINITY_DN107345_c0_g1_i1:41-394(-)
MSEQRPSTNLQILSESRVIWYEGIPGQTCELKHVVLHCQLSMHKPLELPHLQGLDMGRNELLAELFGEGGPRCVLCHCVKSGFDSSPPSISYSSEHVGCQLYFLYLRHSKTAKIFSI